MIEVRVSFPLNILRANGQNLTKFCIHVNIDKIYFGIVNRHFLQICNKVMALDRLQNFISAQYQQNLTKFCIHINIDRILCNVNFFCKFVTELVMALDKCQNFVSAQYLENKWTEFDQILYTHQYWQDLGWDCCATFSHNFHERC